MHTLKVKLCSRGKPKERWRDNLTKIRHQHLPTLYKQKGEQQNCVSTKTLEPKKWKIEKSTKKSNGEDRKTILAFYKNLIY